MRSWLEQRRARRALEAALERMQKLFGNTEVPWGQVNVTIRGGRFPMDGTGLYDVLHPDEGPEQSNGQIFDNDGWGHVMIVMEGEPKEIWSLRTTRLYTMRSCVIPLAVFDSVITKHLLYIRENSTSS